MHKNTMKCNKTQSKWCINKHGASKIMDMFEMYHFLPLLHVLSAVYAPSILTELLPHDTHHQVCRLKFDLDDDDEAESTFHLDTYNPTSTFGLPKSTFMITRLWYNI
jgi:hypothetical protein